MTGGLLQELQWVQDSDGAAITSRAGSFFDWTREWTTDESAGQNW
jgi:hypothetical protein